VKFKPLINIFSIIVILITFHVIDNGGGLVGHVACMKNMINAYKILVRNSEGK
jgi:hypothetical protein